MEKGLITFVITIYRNFAEVYETADSLFMQDYPLLELILSDDGSPEWDAEQPALAEYLEVHKSPNVQRIVWNRLEENRGTVVNTNSAYRLAQGEYLKDLSPGDVLASPDALTRYKEALDASGCRICFARIEGVKEDGTIVRHLASSAEDYDVLAKLEPLELRDRLFARNCLPAPAWFACTDLFEDRGLFPEDARLIEDYPYWISLCTAGERFGFTNQVLVRYRLSNSGAGHYSLAFMKDMFIIYDRYIFPADRRFGPLQGAYNKLKRAGLNAYVDRAQWKDYTPAQKAKACLLRGPLLGWIRFGDWRMKKKNERDA